MGSSQRAAAVVRRTSGAGPGSIAGPGAPGQAFAPGAPIIVTVATTYALRGCSRALLAGPRSALASCSQGAAGGGRWLLMAVRGASRGTRLGLIVTALGTELDPVHEACARFFEGDRSSWKGRFRPAWFTDTYGWRSFPPLRKVIKNPVQSGQAAPGWMAASARHISIMRLLSLGYETTDVRLCRLRKSPVTVLTSPDRRREVVLAPPRLPLLGLSRSVRFTKRFTEPVVDRGFAVLQQARPRTLRPVGSSRRLTSATPPRTSALGRRGMAHPARVRRADLPGEIIAGSTASGTDRATGKEQS